MNHQISYRLIRETDWSIIKKLMNEKFSVFTHNSLYNKMEAVKDETIKVYSLRSGQIEIRPLIDLKDFDYYYCIYNGSVKPSVVVDERYIIIYEHRKEQDATSVN